MSTPDAHRVRLLRRAVRLVAGRSTWGWLDVWPSRYGFTHHRLVVCPPGTSTSERALLRLWRTRPTLAVLTGGLLLLVSLAAGLRPIGMAAVAGSVVAAVLLVLARATRRQRPLVRVRFGATEDVDGVPSPLGDMALIDRCWTRLATAERAMRSGRCTALEHELVWTEVWNDLAPVRRVPRALERPSAVGRRPARRPHR